jgi:hypothetical protein
LTKNKKKCTFLIEGGKNYASSQKNSEKDNSEENNKSKSKKDNEEVRKGTGLRMALPAQTGRTRRRF